MLHFMEYKGIYTIAWLLVAVCFFVLEACNKDKTELPVATTGYPKEIHDIIVTKCATAGCHNDKSKEAAAGLSLETWDRLFEGSRGGAVVIPYRADFSTLIYYTNSDSNLGAIQLLPTMPFNQPPLSSSEVQTLIDWVNNGAPDENGFVKFSDAPERKNFYVGNQGCDVVTVFDAELFLATRYIDVGTSAGIEAPHMVKVSADNKFWYASYIAGSHFQKFSTIDNSLLSSINIGEGSWNTFALSDDNKSAFVVDWEADGRIAWIDLEKETVQYINGLTYPHGSALNQAATVLYLTSQSGNYVYKIDIANPAFISYEQIVLKPGQSPNNLPGTLDPHEVSLSGDESKYFVTCQASDEVRVMDTNTDTLIAIINVGNYPQEMSVSKTHPYLFVSCMEDVNDNPDERGSIAVIDYNTYTLVKEIYAGYQSHGVAVDDENGRVYITNRNVNPGGPAPHHASVCGGRNGNVTAIDLTTLELIPEFKTEVSVDPYALGIMH